MKCPTCQFENPDGFAFCGQCGTKLDLPPTCPSCGAEIPDGFAFCGRCGTRLEEAPAPPTLVTQEDLARLEPYLPRRAFGDLPPAPLWETEDLVRSNERLSELLETIVTYLPRQLVQMELAAGEVPPVGGRFVDGALLFADISGFTTMSEQLATLGKEGAEQITTLVNGYFDTMLAVLFAHGGDLFKFGGDALLAFFPTGEDAPHPDGTGGSLRALAAAWAMQQAMADFHQVETSLGTFALQMKIGLHAGPVFLARVGDAQERELIVTGPTVNATARAESLAQAGQILISPTVRQQIAAAKPDLLTTAAGPEGHFVVEQIRAPASAVSEATPPPPLRELLGPDDDPSAALRRRLDALDRLTPYLPPGLLRRVVPDPSRHETIGEHRLVAVLFANFVGTSELVTRLGHERADEIAGALHQYFLTARQAVARYGGVVNKVDLSERGDKLMVLFGAPVAHEDDAERAVRAALELLDCRLPTLDETADVQNPQPKIGVSTGLVFAGHVGGAKRREYTVMGDEVNLAARLMSAAQAGEILLSGFVRRKVSPFFELADRGAVELKGKHKPVPTFTIVGRRAQPEPVRGIRGLRSPLVGREKEEKTLQRLIDELDVGRGSVVSLIGEAGLGKSRLVAELRGRALGTAAAGERVAPDLTWLEGRCLSYTQQVSYSAFTDLMHDALGIGPTDNEFDIRAKLHRRVEALLSDESAADILPYLAHFLGLPVSGPEAERVTYLDGEALQRQILRSVTTFLQHLARRRPLVLAFDDLHWADSASLALLERCLTLTDRSPVLILLIYRPERSHGCWMLGQTAARDYPHRYTQLQLSPLDSGAGQDEQLVRNLLSIDQLPPALADLIHRAEGNPFYVEEIIRTLIDQGAITQDDGRWRLVQPADLRTVPDTLQGIIMARMDRLMEEARATLQLASVVGRTFRHQMLAWLASAAALTAPLDASLATLQRAELIRERSRIPDVEFGFKHIMIRDVAYESLLVRDRRTYHRLVAQHLEETYVGQKREEIFELLAHHYSHSEEREKALEYLIKAGDKARRAYANPEAMALYRQAEPLAQALERPEEEAAIAEGLGSVLSHIGEYGQALTCYERALCCCATDVHEADLHRRIAMVHEKRGEYEKALAACARGIELLTPDDEETTAPQLPAELVVARLLTVRCRVYTQQGQFEPALADGQRSLALLKGTTHYRELARAHNELGTTYRNYSRPEQAIEHFKQGLRILERIGDEHDAARVYNNLAILYYQTDLALAAEYFGRSLETMRRLGNVPAESTLLQNLGVIHYARRDYERAIDYYQQSLRMKKRLGDSLGIADCHINLGEVYRDLEDLDQAIAHLERGLDIAQEIGASQAEAECHRQLANCYLENDEPQRALAASREALVHAKEIGDRKEEAIIYRVMGQAQRQQGELVTAQALLEQSVAILRELNQEFDLGKVLYDYAQVLVRLEQAERARERLGEALGLFEKLQLPQERARVEEALRQLSGDSEM